MSAPASPALRWAAALLLFVAASLSIAVPFVSATLFTIAIGGVAIAAGISQLLRITGPGDNRSKFFRLFSALSYLAGGIWILAFPINSAVSLTLFVGFLLAFQGITELVVAASAPGSARGLVLLDGVATTILGGLLIAEWPSDSLWAVGTLLGVGLALSGLNLLTAPPAPQS